MPSMADWQAALAVCAAIIGAGFASGREIVSFFSCFGSASWLGIAAASAGIGGLIYVIMRLAQRTGAGTFPGLYGALMGQSCEDALHMLHGLLCLLTASAMLAAGGELGALSFPVRHSRALGFLLTLLAALASTASGFRMLPAMGALLAPLSAVYFIAMASGAPYSPPLSAQNLPAALPTGLLYAAFNSALAGGTICMAGRHEASPARTAVLTGGILFLLLSSANLAMLKAGAAILSMELPSVALAARWGVCGFYSSILILWLAVLTTLCAMLHSLGAQLSLTRLPPSASLLTAGAASCIPAVFGFRALVEAVYPLLGWICGFALAALLLYLPEAEASSHDH